MLTLEEIQAIDDRVRRGEGNVTQLGTVVERTFDDNALVVFDDSQGAIPVKVAGGVEAYVGDRVGLVKFGTWWIAVLSMAHRWPSDNGDAHTMATGGTTTSATYADTPDVVQASFTKRWDLTRVRVFVSASFSNVGAVALAQYGVTFTSPTMGTTNTLFVAQMFDNYLDAPNAQHRHCCGVMYFPGGTAWNTPVVDALPAGDYTVRMRWRRASGTGTLSMDVNDLVTLSVAEVAP